ncbi:MAG: SDR family NAD(P)-dependent oxidoreductase [Planctomycetaceae bacterium]|jgi:NAD(P)-dependent dehydrogenase (short-subunit alcohol dehydrogenase family)|nr:SDR family NAD(P)-dependent oxidoreductase [Planctomycetaceae bacterium]
MNFHRLLNRYKKFKHNMVQTLKIDPYWQNKIVLVTGGSSGLGRIIAEEFFHAGAKLTIAALEKDDVERAAHEIGSGVLPVHADITKQDEVNRIFETIRKHWGGLDVLVNNAGRSMRGRVLDTTPEQFQSLFDLNVLGTIRCTQAAAAMLLEHRGHIVNIGSLAAKSATRYVGAYPVSKFAVAAYSQQLRLELGQEGLHVLLVCPGPIRRERERLYPLEGLEGIPDSARAPGAGVKAGRIDPHWLARKILHYCKRRKPELIVPAKAKILFALAQLFPTLGDWIVKKNS